MATISLGELNRLGQDDFTAALDNVFEHSPWIAARVAAARPFLGVKQLFDAMASVVASMPEDQQRALIKVHPDLANKAQRAAGLTSESNAEQNSAGLDRLSDAEYAALAARTHDPVIVAPMPCRYSRLR